MKVGVIGCGVIARKAHLPAYRDLNVDIVGVADLIGKKAKSCARKFKIEKWFTDYHDLLKEDLDLVSICTPPSTHAKTTVDAAEMGINVLVEKPMATNLQDAERMIDVCRDMNVKLCVAHNYRFFPCIAEAKKRLENGRIGSVISMHAIGHDYIDIMNSRWRFGKWGVLEDLGPHLIDIINFLCNSTLKDVKVIARDFTDHMGCLNHVEAIMLFENKACVDLDLSWVSSTYEMSMKVLGTAGTLDIDIRNNHLREIHGYSTPVEELHSILKKSIRTIKAVVNKTYFKGPLLYHQLIIKRFIESIVNGTNLPVSEEEGKAVVSILDSIKSKCKFLKSVQKCDVSNIRDMSHNLWSFNDRRLAESLRL